MVNLTAAITVVVYLIYLSDLSSAFLRKSPRRGSSRGSRRGFSFRRKSVQGHVELKPGILPEVSYGTRGGSLVLECDAVGVPSPTVHWLKNGERIQQGVSHDTRNDEAFFEMSTGVSDTPVMQLSSTKSRLFLDCLGRDDEGVYSCVGESPYVRKVQSTTVKLRKSGSDVFSDLHDCFGKRSNRGEPARIYMWTNNRLEYQGNKVQLYCRAQGFPVPTIIWYDVFGNLIQDTDDYRIARNGDLIISQIAFRKHMGSYRCVADNGFGTNSTDSFLYPTRRDW